MSVFKDFSHYLEAFFAEKWKLSCSGEKKPQCGSRPYCLGCSFNHFVDFSEQCGETAKVKLHIGAVLFSVVGGSYTCPNCGGAAGPLCGLCHGKRFLSAREYFEAKGLNQES